MTPEQVISVCEKYAEKLKSAGATPGRVPPEEKGPYPFYMRNHLLWMCEETKTYAKTNMEKACRWLGFIQGVLWAVGDSSIDELKDDNR